MSTIFISKTDTFFLKIVFKIAGFFGIFPLLSNSLMRKIHFIIYICLNLGIIYLPLESFKIVTSYNVDGFILVEFGVTYIIYGCIHILCIYGTVTQKQTWKEFFDITEKLENRFPLKEKAGNHSLKLLILIVVIGLAQASELMSFKDEFTIHTFFAYWVGTLANFEVFFITITTWEISNVLSAKYTHVIKFINLIFFNRRQNNLNFSKDIIQIQWDIYFLHKAVVQINVLLGKMMLTLFALTLATTLTFFNFSLFLYKEELTEKTIVGAIISLKHCSVLTVNIIYIQFFYLMLNNYLPLC